MSQDAEIELLIAERNALRVRAEEAEELRARSDGFREKLRDKLRRVERDYDELRQWAVRACERDGTLPRFPLPDRTERTEGTDE